MAPFWLAALAVRTLRARVEPGMPRLWTVRVLLVDDEERMVAALRRGLTAEGFVVESAPDGRDAGWPWPATATSTPWCWT